MLRWILPASGVFILLVVNGATDGYFRDEFYYLACARRLAWGYVDHPPLSVAILKVVTTLFGESLLVLRITAAAVAAATIWVTGRLVRRLGGDAAAEALAMTAVAIAPMLLAVATFYSMNVLEVLIWTLAAWVFARALQRPALVQWVLLGVVLGLGLLNKISVLWLGAGIAGGLVVWRRDLLRTTGPWLAGTITALFLLPHVLWQVTNGWPTLEFIRNASAEKMQENAAASFLLDQVLNLHPITFPLWGGGPQVPPVSRRAANHRPLALLYLVPLAILLLNRTSRSSYLAPAYPLLFAAGAVAIAPVLSTRPRRVAAISLLLLLGATTMPLAVPILPTDRYVAYAASLGVAPSTEEKQELARLLQFFADREGWPQLVDAVADVWATLPGDERARAAVLGNYGEAGAIEHLARDLQIPVFSGHNNHWLWGPGSRPLDTIIVLSRSRERQEQRFASVVEAGRVQCGDGMPYENGLTIFIGRGLKVPLEQLWPQLKHYD